MAQCGATRSAHFGGSPNVSPMHNRADRHAAPAREQAGSGTHGSMRLATVTPFTRARQRRQTSTRARSGVVIGRPDSLCACLLQLLDTASCDGTVRATLHSSTTWADLTDTARTESRIEVTALAKGLEEAVESAFTTLTQIGARPRLDVKVTLTPEHVTFALRGVLADPVMTPRAADAITATLRCRQQVTWRLHATDHGSLHWQLTDDC
jgi:hypothetical protein